MSVAFAPWCNERSCESFVGLLRIGRDRSVDAIFLLSHVMFYVTTTFHGNDVSSKNINMTKKS